MSSDLHVLDLCSYIAIGSCNAVTESQVNESRRMLHLTLQKGKPKLEVSV